ncbi:protein ALP1-like isoform X1 [Leptopilina heterotoma]|uniref:protein ALP1-like isoform X1 n=1 Tax=Leptopilina heterotoma TaxID=63436 RepID=UPI001CA9165F|nr:protein ALP1-like isoform X1 [Leptopilina heterotoma]XP_043467580.1 protein ALP1-like isoform X1 [Leptopilina heterotoma]
MDAVAFFEVGLSFLRLLKLRHDINYKKKHFRRWWVKPHIQTCIRNDYGAFSTLFCYFKMHDHEEFYKLYRMSVPQFDKLYEILKTKLERSSAVREPLPPQLRFAITLHFLAHGDSIETLCKLYYIGKSTVYGILSDVCQDIWDILSPVYLPEKSVDDWKEIAIDYEKKCNFPHCLGSIDGKHIRITKPPNSGSAFFNYKKYYSFVLMAICDAHYRFTWIDVGDYGSLNDASVFGATGLAQELEEKRLPLPEPECLPGTQSSIPYFLIGDEAFKLRPYMMRPYPRRLVTTSREELFNYCLSSTRMRIEDSLGVLVGKWRVFHKALGFNLSTSVNIVKAAVCLHNCLITSELNDAEERKKYLNKEILKNISKNRNMEDSRNEENKENETCDSDGWKIRDILTSYLENRKK